VRRCKLVRVAGDQIGIEFLQAAAKSRKTAARLG